MLTKSKKLIAALALISMIHLRPSGAQEMTQNQLNANKLYNASVGLINSGDFTGADNLLSQAWKLDPDNPDILCNYGLALMKLGKLQEAKERLLRASQLKPGLAIVWLNLGLAQEGLGDLPGARQSLLKFVDIGKANPYSEKIKAHIPEIDKLIAAGVSTESLNQPDYMDELNRDQRQRWASNRMPLKIHFAPGEGVPGYKPSYDTAMKSAINTWVKALNGKLTFEPVSSKSKADIAVKWSADIKDAVNSSEGGDVRYQANSNGLDHVDITLLTLDSSPTVKLTDSIVFWISLHEFGHGLGIVGHSHNPTDVMYFSAPQKVSTKLSDRDIQTIRKLYSVALDNWMTINKEAVDLLHAGNLAESLAKLDAAQKLNPTEKSIKTNIKLVETRLVNQLLSDDKIEEIEPHILRALVLEEESRDENLENLLRSYTTFLERVNREKEIPAVWKRFGLEAPQ